MAYGDLNNDGKNDIVTVSDDSQTLRVYLYKEDTQKFFESTKITSLDLFNNSKIISVMLCKPFF